MGEPRRAHLQCNSTCACAPLSSEQSQGSDDHLKIPMGQLHRQLNIQGIGQLSILGVCLSSIAPSPKQSHRSPCSRQQDDPGSELLPADDVPLSPHGQVHRCTLHLGHMAHPVPLWQRCAVTGCVHHAADSAVQHLQVRRWPRGFWGTSG